MKIFLIKVRIFSKNLEKTLAFFFVIGYNKQAFFENANGINATVAQSVEQLIRNQQVAGSSPASSSKKMTFMQRICVNVIFYA